MLISYNWLKSYVKDLPSPEKLADVFSFHICELESFEKIALGAANCGPIAQLDVPSRFRWLTAVRSSAIQTSRPHPGMTNDLEQTVNRLFTELVL